jgi:two-component system phosphate regulon sensor histidine kinase PhoR
MNRETSVTNILLCLTTAFSAIAALAWVFAPALAATSLLVRLLIVVVLLAATVPVLATFIHQRLRNERLGRTILDELSRCDASTLCVEEHLERTLSAPPQHPWQSILLRLRDVLVEQGRRLAEAEHARARAEIRSQRLITERRQLAEILAGLSDPVLAIDQYDELVLANPSAESALQFEAQSTDKRALDTLVHCEQLVELLRDTRRRKAPTTRTSELTLLDPNGEEHTYRVTCRSLTCDAKDGSRQSPHGAVAVLHDIAQLKAIQKRNAEFVSSVSHEMKAPLSGIKAYVELLADGDAEDEATREEFLGVISSQADRLQRLVENLLNLARIEAGVVEVHKQPRSLNELMEDAINVVTPGAEAKQIELVNDLSPMYLEVFADRDMILQAVINLLSNAVKYTPNGGRVTLRTRMEDNNQAVFEVEDTGVGLNAEDCSRVFEKFYRVKKDSQMAQGTGLGLPLAKHIVEDVHGGTLVVESVVGRGSTFRAILPSAGCLTAAKA